jgi:hypothetical protein
MRSCLIAALLACAGPLQAQVTAGATPLATEFIRFDSLGTSTVAHDGVLTVDSLSFAERFAGQSLSNLGGHDKLGSSAASPLALLPGAPGKNLSSAFDGSGITYLMGVGPLGFPSFDATGEGSFAVLFPVDQSQVSFRTYHASGAGGDLSFDFFSRSGALLDTVVLNDVSDGTKGFARDGGAHDIAGVSVWSAGGNGVVLLEAVNFDRVTPVPEPSTWALMLAGLACCWGWARRRPR